MARIHTGTCFCGEVALEVTGEPQAMGYCHCRSCRAWSGGPVNTFAIWPQEAVKVVRGAERIGSHSQTGQTQRQFCQGCGGHLMAAIPSFGIIDVLPAILPGLGFVPQMHIHYGETVLPMRDGLPKLRDLPAEAGGSGELLPE